MNSTLSRREFLEKTMAVSAITVAGTAVKAAEEKKPQERKPVEYSRKLKVGIIGGGHRGNLVGGFMRQHGGYQIHAVADYFPNVAQAMGEKFGVEKARCFSGLSGYRKVIESGVEAVAILDLPYFFAEQARAAVDAGCHVYLAKPVAVDVPGTLAIGTAAEDATRKNRCFLVDFQLSIDPANAEVIQRIRDGGLGGLAHIMSFGNSGAWADPPRGATIENIMQHWQWSSTVAISGDSIVGMDIHIIDGIMAALGKRPVSATGASRVCRPHPNGDRVDACSVVYEFDDGVIWNHMLQSLNNNSSFSALSANFYGLTASAQIGYFCGNAFVRGGDKHYVGKVSKSIYNDGPIRNVADFYTHVTEGHCENATVKRAVDGNLSGILGRESALRHTKLTMEQVLKENRKLELDLTGLKA